MSKTLTLQITINSVENSTGDGNIRPCDLSQEMWMQVRKQQLEQGMEENTGSKEEMELVKAVLSPAYLTYMSNMS